MVARLVRAAIPPLLLSALVAALDCSAQVVSAPEAFGRNLREKTAPIRQPKDVTDRAAKEVELGRKVVRQALRYVPEKLRLEDCLVFADLEAALAGRDPTLIRQAREFEAFVLENRYPIFINLNSPLLRSAIRAYLEDPLGDSVYIYLLAAVLAHERVHAGDPQGVGQKPGNPDESKAYRTELSLLYHFHNLGYIGGRDVERYIDHVEAFAQTYQARK